MAVLDLGNYHEMVRSRSCAENRGRHVEQARKKRAKKIENYGTICGAYEEHNLHQPRSESEGLIQPPVRYVEDLRGLALKFSKCQIYTN